MYYYLAFPGKASTIVKPFIFSFSPHSQLHPQGALNSFANRCADCSWETPVPGLCQAVARNTARRQVLRWVWSDLNLAVGAGIALTCTTSEVGPGLPERTRALLLTSAFKMVLWIFAFPRESLRDSLRLNLSRLRTTSTQLSILPPQLTV